MSAAAARGSKRKASSPHEKETMDNKMMQLFYGDKYSLGMRLKKRDKEGLTSSCYLAQRLLLIRYVIDAIYNEGFNPITHADYEQNILNLISGFINYSNHLFEGQEGMKIKDFLQRNVPLVCIDRIRHLTRLSSAQFYFEGEFENCKKLKWESQEAVNNLFSESEHYPIPLAFGIDKDSGAFDIDHWFTLYQGKLYGAAGLDGLNIKFSILPITPEQFHIFLQSMCKTDDIELKEKRVRDLHNFLNYYFVPFEHAIRPRKLSKKTHTYERVSDVDADVKRKIDKFINSFTPENIHKYNIFKQIGYKNEPYTETLRETIECVQSFAFKDGEAPFVGQECAVESSAGGKRTNNKVKRCSNKRLTCKRLTRKCLTRKCLTRKCLTRKRRSNKRRSNKRRSNKRHYKK